MKNKSRLIYALSYAALCLGFHSVSHASQHDSVLDSADTSSVPEEPKGLKVSGTIDAFYYRFDQDGETESTWNFSGIRENGLVFQYFHDNESPDFFQPIFTLGVKFGADRGEAGRDYKINSSLASAGVATPWGSLSYGKQYSVMTNYAWSLINPIAQGWGVYFNDPLYAGDSFLYGNRNEDDLKLAGANFFLGYDQTGLIYQFQGDSFSVEFDYIPGGTFSRNDGSTKGLGLSKTLGDLTALAAYAKQDSAEDSSSRTNRAFGFAYQVLPHVRVSVGKLESSVSFGGQYDMQYGGAGWQATEKLHLSIGLSNYKQNEFSGLGAGKSTGGAVVAEYAWTNDTTWYVEFDRRRYQGADDGLQTVFENRGKATNVMVGFYRNFN